MKWMDHWRAARTSSGKPVNSCETRAIDVLQAEGNIPGLVMGREQAARDLTAAQAEHKRHVAAVEELKMETDVQMNAYLKQENVGKEKAAVVQASFLEVGLAFKEILGYNRYFHGGGLG